MKWFADGGQRGGAEPDTEEESENAETAVPAVAHDREFRLAVIAAAEPVGGVGEPVLVERAGQRDADEHREPRRHGTAATEQLGDQEGERSETADAGADQRKRPARGGDRTLFARHLDAGRQARQHRSGDGELLKQTAPRIHAATISNPRSRRKPGSRVGTSRISCWVP